MFQWYSYWSVILSLFNSTICLVSVSLRLYFYYTYGISSENQLSHDNQRGDDESGDDEIREDTMKLIENGEPTQPDETISDKEHLLQWMRNFDYMRDLVIMITIVHSLTSHVTFWIVYCFEQWPITYPSIAGHTVVFFVNVGHRLLTTSCVTWLDPLFSFYYTVIYFCFHIWTFYKTGTWVYGSLNPLENPFWFWLITGIPLIQFIMIPVTMLLDYFKHRVYIWGYHTFEVQMVNINTSYNIKRNEHYRTDLFVLQSMVLFLVLFLGFMSMAPYTMNTLLLIHLIYIAIYVFVEFGASIYNFQYVFKQPSVRRTDLYHMDMLVLINRIATVMLLIHTIGAAGELIIHLSSFYYVWIYLTYLICGVLILFTKCLQYVFMHPFLKKGNNLYNTFNPVLYRTYFG